MGQPQQPTRPRLQHLLLLLGQLEQTSEDPLRQIQLALDRMAELTAARVGITLQVPTLSPRAVRPDCCRVITAGGEIKAEAMTDYLERKGIQQSPLFERLCEQYLACEDRGPKVFRRRDLLADERWYGHPHVQTVRRTWGTDDVLIGISPTGTGNGYNLLMLCRGWGEARFEEQMVSLFRFFWHAAGPRFTAELPVPVDATGQSSQQLTDPSQLPPRLRQVFTRLLAGYDASQVAEELGLSIYTIYEHMQRLYRRLGVEGRQQLVALYGRAYMPHRVSQERLVPTEPDTGREASEDGASP